MVLSSLPAAKYRGLISALRAACGGCAPKRACGRSPRGNGECGICGCLGRTLVACSVYANHQFRHGLQNSHASCVPDFRPSAGRSLLPSPCLSTDHLRIVGGDGGCGRYAGKVEVLTTMERIQKRNELDRQRMAEMKKAAEENGSQE